MVYKGWTFLLLKPDETPFSRSLAEVQGTIDKLKPGKFPEYVFGRITTEIFQKESGMRQPFIVYPEMNDCVPKADKKEASNDEMQPTK
jgi:hypothetical protein